MSTKFTPGPWMATRSLYDSRVVVCTEYNQRVDVATTYAAGCGVPVEANAHLIAAAPELYEALEQVARPYGMLDLAVSEHVHGPRGDDMLAVAKIIRAALAKARGEQA